MLVTNATGHKIRLSIMKDISMDESAEAFAYVIGKGCSLSVSLDDSVTISLEEQ